MDKRIKTVVPETQQEITAQIERDEDELIVTIRACTELDDDLRAEFREEIHALETDAIVVTPKTYTSNQGNDLAEDVTVKFAIADQLAALDVIRGVIAIGKLYHDRQLERNLEDEQDGDSNYWHKRQQKHFDDEQVKQFCLLYRGLVSA